MRLSNSKQQLAKIISENGGWRNGAEFAWYGNQTKKGWFGISKPRYSPKQKSLQILRPHLAGSFPCRKPNNWHQTILSRAEYFHLYPAPGAVADEPEHIWTNPPTIEQLAADYRNAKDYADRKQQEADDAKADVGAKLKALKLAGKEHGLLVSPITAKQEQELSITDWRDLRVGDVIELTGSLNPCWKEHAGIEMTVNEVHHDQGDNDDQVDLLGESGAWSLGGNTTWRFIRRP